MIDSNFKYECDEICDYCPNIDELISHICLTCTFYQKSALSDDMVCELSLLKMDPLEHCGSWELLKEIVSC
jgi:hypothetical protein